MSVLNPDSYNQFALDMMVRLGCHKVDAPEPLWHYTRGESLVEILRSGELWATHLSCLNDSSEYVYASTLFAEALKDLPDDASDGERVADFKRCLREVASSYHNRAFEHRASSDWYVASLSGTRNDLSQWRAYTVPDNGFAIAFKPGVLQNEASHLLSRVNYDPADHLKVAQQVANETIRYYVQGLEANQSVARDLYMQEFLSAWGQAIDILSTLVKHPGFDSEDEYRFCARLSYRHNGFEDVVIRQKPTILARHLKLRFNTHPLLPIQEIMIGPGHHQASTRVAVQMLLASYNYLDPRNLVTCSNIPAQAI